MEAVRYNGKTWDHTEKLLSVVNGKGEKGMEEAEKGKKEGRGGRGEGRGRRGEELCVLLPALGLTSLEKVVLFPFCGTKDINTSRIPNW